MTSTTPSLALRILPQSCTDFIQVSVESAIKEKANLNIYNVYGQAVYRTSFDLLPGTNLYEIAVDELPAGSYYIHYKTPDTKIFIINKIEKRAS